MLLLRPLALYPQPGSQKGRKRPPTTDIPITQAVVSFTRINVVQNHAESADLRQTTKIVIAEGGVRACVRDQLGETL